MVGGCVPLRTETGQQFGKPYIKCIQKQEKQFKNWQITCFWKQEPSLSGTHSNGKTVGTAQGK